MAFDDLRIIPIFLFLICRSLSYFPIIEVIYIKSFKKPSKNCTEKKYYKDKDIAFHIIILPLLQSTEAKEISYNISFVVHFLQFTKKIPQLTPHKIILNSHFPFIIY